MEEVRLHLLANSESLRASDLAYQRLRKAIVTLKLPPGSVINEAGLMNEFQVGRTPLREALNRLAMDRLVVVMPRRGTYVSEIGVLDLHHITEIRVELEGLSVMAAVERASDKDLDEMRALVEKMKKAVQKLDYETLMNHDRAFHILLAKASRNNYLVSILDSLIDQSLRFWYLSFSRAGQLDQTLAEHLEVLRAVEARDGETANKAIQLHILKFKEKVLSTL